MEWAAVPPSVPLAKHRKAGVVPIIPVVRAVTRAVAIRTHINITPRNSSQAAEEVVEAWPIIKGQKTLEVAGSMAYLTIRTPRHSSSTIHIIHQSHPRPLRLLLLLPQLGVGRFRITFRNSSQLVVAEEAVIITRGEGVPEVVEFVANPTIKCTCLSNSLPVVRAAVEVVAMQAATSKGTMAMIMHYHFRVLVGKASNSKQFMGKQTHINIRRNWSHFTPEVKHRKYNTLVAVKVGHPNLQKLSSKLSTRVFIRMSSMHIIRMGT